MAAPGDLSYVGLSQGSIKNFTTRSEIGTGGPAAVRVSLHTCLILASASLPGRTACQEALYFPNLCFTDPDSREPDVWGRLPYAAARL